MPADFALREPALPHLALHHLGVATRSIDRELAVYEALGYRAASDLFTDPGLGIRGLFVEAPGQPRLELLENLKDAGPLDSALKRGMHVYHFAYVADDLERAVQNLIRQAGARVIVPVTRAEHFERICFLMMPNMFMIELVQAGAASS